MIYDVYLQTNPRCYELLIKADSKEEALHIMADLMTPKYGIVVSYEYAVKNAQAVEYPGITDNLWNSCKRTICDGGAEYVSSKDLLSYIMADGKRLAAFETRVPLMRLAGIAMNVKK